jgi:hypothetical protein
MNHNPHETKIIQRGCTLSTTSTRKCPNHSTDKPHRPQRLHNRTRRFHHTKYCHSPDIISWSTPIHPKRRHYLQSLSYFCLALNDVVRVSVVRSAAKWEKKWRKPKKSENERVRCCFVVDIFFISLAYGDYTVENKTEDLKYQLYWISKKKIKHKKFIGSQMLNLVQFWKCRVPIAHNWRGLSHSLDQSMNKTVVSPATTAKT